MLYKVIINISIPPQPKNTMLPIPPNTFVGHEVLASWSMKYPPAAKSETTNSQKNILPKAMVYSYLFYIFISLFHLFISLYCYYIKYII